MHSFKRNHDNVMLWSCEKATKNLLAFINRHYHSRDFLNIVIENQRKKYKNGSFTPNNAFEAFCNVVSFALKYYSEEFGYPDAWYKRYNTYTRRKAEWKLFNENMSYISKG